MGEWRGRVPDNYRSLLQNNPIPPHLRTSHDFFSVYRELVKGCCTETESCPLYSLFTFKFNPYSCKFKSSFKSLGDFHKGYGNRTPEDFVVLRERERIG